MSTQSQVNADYYLYVCQYLINNGAMTNANVNNSENIFKLSVDSSGSIFTYSLWTPVIAQPTITNLMEITPSSITTLRKIIHVNKIFLSNPELLTIVRDIYNHLPISAVNTNSYTTNATLGSYLQSLF
jgi:hypothetical protein